MKILLLMNENAYAGREYASQMIKSNIVFDIATVGDHPKFDSSEDIRCGGLWNPPIIDNDLLNIKINNFSSLNSNFLIDFLSKNKFDIGIQGGTGILKKNVINKFKYGVLNFHPGDLPDYQGCSAPEWQIYENKNVISTCHFIDQGIDSGPILDKCLLNVSLNNYFEFRASIYPQTSIFVVNTIKKFLNDRNFLDSYKLQKKENFNYRKYIGKERIEELKIKFLKQE
tara:strand:- start:12686 stop:13366 length:681 start_codon:yes stop_codon:yes gene_type:complete